MIIELEIQIRNVICQACNCEHREVNIAVFVTSTCCSLKYSEIYGDFHFFFDLFYNNPYSIPPQPKKI